MKLIIFQQLIISKHIIMNTLHDKHQEYQASQHSNGTSSQSKHQQYAQLSSKLSLLSDIMNESSDSQITEELEESENDSIIDHKIQNHNNSLQKIQQFKEQQPLPHQSVQQIVDNIQKIQLQQPNIQYNTPENQSQDTLKKQQHHPIEDQQEISSAPQQNQIQQTIQKQNYILIEDDKIESAPGIVETNLLTLPANEFADYKNQSLRLSQSQHIDSQVQDKQALSERKWDQGLVEEEVMLSDMVGSESAAQKYKQLEQGQQNRQKPSAFQQSLVNTMIETQSQKSCLQKDEVQLQSKLVYLSRVYNCRSQELQVETSQFQHRVKMYLCRISNLKSILQTKDRLILQLINIK